MKSQGPSYAYAVIVLNDLSGLLMNPLGLLTSVSQASQLCIVGVCTCDWMVRSRSAYKQHVLLSINLSS